MLHSMYVCVCVCVCVYVTYALLYLTPRYIVYILKIFTCIYLYSYNLCIYKYIEYLNIIFFLNIYVHVCVFIYT